MQPVLSENKKDEPNAKAINLGYWSAILATLFSVGFTVTVIVSAMISPSGEWSGIEQYAASFQTAQVIPVVPPLLLAPTFVALVASLYLRTSQDKKIFGLIALSFTIMYATIIWIIDYIELTVVRQNILNGTIEGLALWAIPNPRSLFFALEAAGYFFLGISTLFAAPLFGKGTLETWIRWFFVTNGLISIAGIIAYAFGNVTTVFATLIIWAMIFPLATALIAMPFRRAKVGSRV
ncbi:MAG: hypothetical protein HY665_05600 [Chloroflexi bacterium]|nr:hypothetical protein [Chloroflexota bacterium]